MSICRWFKKLTGEKVLQQAPQGPVGEWIDVPTVNEEVVIPPTPIIPTIVFEGLPGLTDTSDLSKYERRQLSMVNSQRADTIGANLKFKPYGGGLYTENISNLNLGNIEAEGVHSLKFEKTKGKIGNIIHSRTNIGVHVGKGCKLVIESITSNKTKDRSGNGNGDSIIVEGLDAIVEILKNISGVDESDCVLDIKGLLTLYGKLYGTRIKQSVVKCWNTVTLLGGSEIVEPVDVAFQSWANVGVDSHLILDGTEPYIVRRPKNPRVVLKMKNGDDGHKSKITLKAPVLVELKPEHEGLTVDQLINYQGGTIEGKEWIKII